MACLCAFGQAAAPAQDASGKIMQITADKVVLNVNAPGMDALRPPPDGQPGNPPPPPPMDHKPLFSGDFMKALDTLADWDGFRPWKIVYFICGLILALLLSRGVRWLIENYLNLKLAKRTPSEYDDLLFMALGRPASMLTFTVCMYLSCLPVLESMPPNIHGLCDRLFMAFGAASIAWAAYRLVEVLDKFLLKVAASTDNSLDDLIVGIIRKIVKVCIVFVSVLFIGQNILGLNITTLLAGAGVAGLAIAFAAQDTIANFFGSLMIIIDQPFTVGDYVKIDAYEGNIERVGLRSSALRTPGGHLITIPNKLAANCSIENISRRPYIRNIANYGLVYDTSPERIEEAIRILKDIFDKHDGMSEKLPPYIHFTEFKDSSLNIQVITWYHPADFLKHLEFLNKMNLEILRRFNAAGLEFAFPSTTTYMGMDAKQKLALHLDGKA